MRMLESIDDEVDAEVTFEDQQRISKFSKFNSRMTELEETLEQKKQEKEVLDDLSTELELADEDDPVLYKVGDAFVHIPLSDAQELLVRDQTALDKELDELRVRMEECENTMKDLKLVLYSKFGKAINLDL
ncbi:hypothetical protein FRB96_005123 [Tulasnella sp. 330]|nr:hypothetical protein FRB96_005123 [Tulasnella sp. 330]KAG8881496.1 hypothetical protein FRB97_009550 [Tulasnella sp. 331]